MAYDAVLLSAVLSIFIQCVFQFLRWKAKTELGLRSVTMGYPGSVTSIQRSSSHLSLNIHFHALVTDGVFVQEEPGGEVQFHALTPPTDDEVTAVAQDICCKTIELLKSKGIWKDHESDTEDTFASQEPALAHAYQASVRGVLSTGPRSGQRVVRFFGAAAQSEQESAKRSTNAFDLHARRATFAYDREAVERLARYILRPPVAQDSLERLGDGRIALRLKRAWKDGTTAVVFEPLDLMSKLTALIPKPRTNVIRFHGVYAPNAKLRSHVLPVPPTHDACGHRVEPDPKQKGHRLKWAQLLARVFQVDVFSCPKCSGRMQRISWILNKNSIQRILASVGLATDSPEPHRPHAFFDDIN